MPGSTLFMPTCDATYSLISLIAQFVDARLERFAAEIIEEGIACTKSVCNYIYNTYGRFPGSVDAMQLMWFMQAHHLDIEYYDRFFRPGAYGATHGSHLARWHP